MAIFRGTGGAGDSTDDSIVSEVTEQAGIATTKAQEAATSATNASNSASSASSSETAASTSATAAAGSASTATTKASEAASHASDALASKNAAATSATAAADSATAANSANVQTVAGLSTEITNLNGIRTDITGVNAVRADVVTVSGISSDVTTVAADASDIGTVATNITNVNNVGDNISNVNAVHSNASNINTVAADGSDIGTVAGNISNVNTVAGISSDVTTVAGLESKMDAVIADASDIGAVAGNIGNVNTVAGDSSDINTVAGISADVTSVADNMTDVQNADTNAANAATSASNASDSASAASTSAGSASSSASSASTSATNAGNSATAASNSATAASGSASAASGSASAASGSASAAASSASAASTSKSNAATSETNAASSASAAATSATNAATSETNAAASATDSSNAASTWSNYYNTYVGASSSAPTVDVQGNALVAGALYFNTTNNTTYVWTGSAWNAVANNNIINPNVVLTQDLATNGNDIKFGDNDKATFGASDDLKIYHDGFNSYIDESGNGDIRIRSGNVYLDKYTGETMLHADADGAVTAYYDNTARLATTSTGVDVTGTATMDGLSVERENLSDLKTWSNSDVGSVDFYQAASYPSANNYGRVLDINSGSGNSNGGSTIRLLTAEGNFAGRQRLTVNNNGDISFYEDTGTTPKFFWDASAESLGIGTSTPSTRLTVGDGVSSETIKVNAGSGWADIRLDSGASNGGSIYWNDGADSGQIFYYHVDNSMRFHTAATEAMRISSDGHVGIGVTPESWHSNVTALQIGDLGAVWVYDDGSNPEQTHISENVYNNGEERYIESDYASTHQQRSGVHTFKVAPSGTADSAISWTTAMTIDNSANVLVGCTALPSYGNGGAGFETGQSSGRSILQLGTTTTSPETVQRFYNPNGSTGGISLSGSSTSYNTSSDYRLKEDVQPVANASDRLMQLKPCNFAWKADGSRVDGFLAHEAAEVVPEAVSGTKDAMTTEEYEVTPAVYEDVVIPAIDEVLDEDGNVITEAQEERTEQQLVSEAVMGEREVEDYQGIDQSKLVPLLTAALQEALARIEALENK